jgi:membrane protease YdiL (CAAX protease family)
VDSVATTRWALVAVLSTAAFVGLLITGIRLQRRRPILPPIRERRVPWRMLEIISVFILWQITPSLVYGVLLNAGMFRSIYGIDYKPSIDDPMMSRCMLWALAIGAAPLAVALLLIAARGRRRNLVCVGVTGRRAWSGVSAGMLAWVALTPVVFGIHWAINAIYGQLWGKPVEHTLERILGNGAMPAEWILVTIQAVIVAPLFEEFFFRGLLQPWLARYWWGGLLGVIMALGIAFVATPIGWGPAALGVALLVVYVARLAPAPDQAVADNRDPFPRQAIYGSSALFAMTHVGAWPTPIPLFFLAIGLGWLAYRTRGLAAPVVCHAFFNAVSIVVMAIFGPLR